MKEFIRFFIVTMLISNAPLVPAVGQGLNTTWLMGDQSMARMIFTDTSYNITPEVRKIPFIDTQGNISDSNGNLLMSSNGYFIADASGDTMMNGGGLNPNQCTQDYGASDGMFLPYGNIILPMPGDSNQYVLFHQTCDYANPYLSSSEIYYSIIDISLNGGLGAVISKNNVILNGIFGSGLSAVKHGNGRDWWIIALSDSGTVANRILLSPGSIQFIGSQNLQVTGYVAWAGQPTFSPNGEQFAFSHTKYLGTSQFPLDARLFDFDRCLGNFTSKMFLALGDSAGGFGIGFSSNSKYLYVSSTQVIYQFDTNNPNIPLSKTIVAVNDTFLSAPPVFYTNFYLMYLAANGKIYVSSTSSVLDLHEMNFPDSAGIACDVQLHNIHVPHFFIGVPNHPNYYLGVLTGSVCDSLTSTHEIIHDFKFSLSPNPSSGDFKILYLLTQNQNGKLEIYDVNGRSIYEMNLPKWSTMQYISLPSTIADGIYNCVISSGNSSVNKKLVVIRN